MKIEFLKDPLQTEPKIVVVACEEADALELTEQLSRTFGKTLTGYDNGGIVPIPFSHIVRICAEGQRMRCDTVHGTYRLRSRLYELEEQLGDPMFLRISKSEIVNKDKILRLDVSISGSIGVHLEGGIKTYTSRRYMAKIRKAFNTEKEEGL